MNLRNLFQVSNETECTVYCDPACPYYDCYKDPYTSPPPPPPTTTASQSHPLSPYIVVISTSFASFILLVFSYFMIKRCCSRRQGSEENQRAGHEEDHFLDENRGPAIDHHIWYINTEGLQPSIINSISVFRYRKGGNLIEGSECSVCLSEFQEDETLRLLPKCSHAFHTHCIDTWLRSHTNCPLCRARIMSNSNVAQNSVDRNDQEQEEEEGSADLGQEEGLTQMGNSGENGENRGGGVETEGGRDEFDDGVRDWSFMRRSVSMDFGHSYVPKSLAENTHIESEEGASSRNQGSFAVCMKRSLSATCSHSGRVILPRCNRNLNSVLPL